MGHQRYVFKNGKVYGPYTYHSYRDEDGNVKKRYLGKYQEEFKKGELISVSFFILLFLVSMGFIGKIILNSII